VSQGFVSPALVAFGPFIMPVLFLILAGAAWAACYLIYTGIQQRSVWRLIVGVPVALYLAAVFVVAVLIIA
jgi:hypothetical protein